MTALVTAPVRPRRPGTPAGRARPVPRDRGLGTFDWILWGLVAVVVLGFLAWNFTPFLDGIKNIGTQNDLNKVQTAMAAQQSSDPDGAYPNLSSTGVLDGLGANINSHSVITQAAPGADGTPHSIYNGFCLQIHDDRRPNTSKYAYATDVGKTLAGKTCADLGW